MASEANKQLTFKFEFRGQLYELASLTSDDTVGNLRAVICSMLNIENFRRIDLKTLRPTKVLDCEDDSRLLSEVFNQARERIVVEEVQDTSSVQETVTSNIQDFSHLDPTPSSTDRIYPVCSSTGYLLRHPVPSNNSCLFISVHFCLTNGIVDDQIGKSMRKIIADTVSSDTLHFDAAFLGKPNADYCDWIMDDNNWGGAIELSILCKYYETEIVAIDVKNTILNRFGEDSHYPQRMLLLYDGLHYDPLKFQPLDDNETIQTLFSSDNIEVLTLAEELAKEAKQSHQFTDMKTITMRCTVCNIDLDAKSAQDHATKTGHVEFVEK